jgi:hypothetical protein
MKGDNDDEKKFRIYILKLKECIRAWRRKETQMTKKFLEFIFKKFRELHRSLVIEGKQ